MKYIRTDAGKFLAYDENADDLDKPCILFYKDQYKEADTIEELCDGFLGVNKFDPKEHFFCAYKPKKPSNGMHIYGFIWTTGEHGEPILKSVTKPMNEKGVLELL